MVVKRVKKVRKMRGSKTHGWGSKKKHRGKGSKGGRGFAGSMSHKRLMILKKFPDHFGKKGFTRPNRRELVTINLKELDLMLEKMIHEKKLKPDKLKINLKELGFDKLLGNGRITRKVTVEVPLASASAKSKVEEAGGEVIELS
ncbi:MAG: 50S ribosomal protein L15 [Candidatus Aenigmatarchaeota archaeon]|nr:MAG: 50S ribosomal protein L15 [Candidatus Aenigmarchaeota archaeon]